MWGGGDDSGQISAISRQGVEWPQKAQKGTEGVVWYSVVSIEWSGAAGTFLLLVVLPGVEAGFAAYAFAEVSHPIFFLLPFLLALLLAALALLLALYATVCL